jgi:hypothetical protein
MLNQPAPRPTSAGQWSRYLWRKFWSWVFVLVACMAVSNPILIAFGYKAHTPAEAVNAFNTLAASLFILCVVAAYVRRRRQRTRRARVAAVPVLPAIQLRTERAGRSAEAIVAVTTPSPPTASVPRRGRSLGLRKPKDLDGQLDTGQID